jgi:hypothetical protein
VGEVILLPCAEITLVIAEQTGVAWYGCSLRADSRDTYLGAENRAYLLTHLQSVVEPEEQATSVGVIEDHRVRWVLSLAEVHHSLYVRDGPAEVKTLYWQDRDGRTVGVSRLSQSNVLEWRSILNMALASSASLPQ